MSEEYEKLKLLIKKSADLQRQGEDLKKQLEIYKLQFNDMYSPFINGGYRTICRLDNNDPLNIVQISNMLKRCNEINMSFDNLNDMLEKIKGWYILCDKYKKNCELYNENEKEIEKLSKKIFDKIVDLKKNQDNNHILTYLDSF